MPKPLDRELSEALRNRAELAARLAAEDAKIQALLKAQRELIETLVEEHELHSVPRPDKVQADMLGQNASGDSRALKIAKTRTKGRKRAPEVQAIYDAGLTPQGAAELCGTSRDVLKQAWAKGDQFRAIREDWKAILAKAGVPKGVWRSSSRG